MLVCAGSGKPLGARPMKVNGKWKICIKGNKEHFGQTMEQRKHPRKAGGITVYADGRCVLDEYAGGFDGYWSTDVGDGHENDIGTAAKQVWPGSYRKCHFGVLIGA